MKRWLITWDEDGYYVREILMVSFDPASNQGTYVTRPLPGTYATMDLAREAAARNPGGEL